MPRFRMCRLVPLHRRPGLAALAAERQRASARVPAGAATPEEQTASVNWATSSAAWSTVIILIIFALFSCHAIANMRFKLVRPRGGARLAPGCGATCSVQRAVVSEWVVPALPLAPLLPLKHTVLCVQPSLHVLLGINSS